MRFGVTYAAILFNAAFTMEVFLLTKNLLVLLLAVPIHGVCALLCARDARFFDLILLWSRTRLLAHFGNVRLWKASSYSALALDLPGPSWPAASRSNRACGAFQERCQMPAVDRIAASFLHNRRRRNYRDSRCVIA